MYNRSELGVLNRDLEKLEAHSRVRQVLTDIGVAQVALASSLGLEDQVLTHMLKTADPAARFFTLDTGRLPQQTYDVMQLTMATYQMNYEVMLPDTTALESLTSSQGPNAFYYSIESRKACCQVRKVDPLKRKLSTLKLWICGLRRDQALTRTQIDILEWDDAFGLFKLNPLADWTLDQVKAYIKVHSIPYNDLHDQGYPTIGCAPCTRAIKPGEEVRAGRWWWESPQTKECGLHVKPVS